MHLKNLPTAPMSVQLSPEDLQGVVNRECSLCEDAARNFGRMSILPSPQGFLILLTRSTSRTLYAERQKLRSAAYKLTEKPETLTDEDFELLLRSAKTHFRTTAMCSDRSAQNCGIDGDVEGAFDWLVQAIQTIRRIDNKIFRMQLDSSSRRLFGLVVESGPGHSAEGARAAEAALCSRQSQKRPWSCQVKSTI